MISGWLGPKRAFLPSGNSFTSIALVVAITPVGLVVGILLSSWYIRSVRRRVAAADGRLCTHCWYDLSALGERGVCSECGTAYSVAALRQAWTKSKLLADPPDL